MSNRRSKEYRRRKAERRWAVEDTVGASLVTWAKASERGLELGKCQWSKRNTGIDPDLDCTEQAKWIMTHGRSYWRLCHKHAAYLHTDPSQVAFFIGRRRFTEHVRAYKAARREEVRA